MASLIERYVYDVTRRLPERDRQEVKQELTANIYDALSENPSLEEIKEALIKLGSPQKLASEYRQKPNYLISPALYGSYIRSIKWIAPLAGGVMFTIGVIVGAFEVLGNGAVDAVGIATGIFTEGFSLGIAGTFHALFWTTVGFAIADRVGRIEDGGSEQWSIDMLPETYEEDKGAIPLSDSIAELIIVVLFTTIALLFIEGVIPFTVTLDQGGYRVSNVFAPSFISLFVPIIIVGCILQVAEDIIKIVQRKWTVSVCVVTLISNAVGIVLLVVLAAHSEVFSAEFITFIEGQTWWVDIGQALGAANFHMGLGQFGVAVLAGFVILGTLISCGVAVYKTVRSNGLISND